MISTSYLLSISFMIRNYSRVHEAILNKNGQVYWKDIIANASDPDDAVHNWMYVFSLILEKHASILTRKVSNKYAPYLDSKFFMLAKTRDELKIQVVKNKSILLMECYRQIRNHVNN